MKQILYADAGNRLLAIVKIYIASRLGTGHYLWPGGGGEVGRGKEDLGLNKVKFSRPPPPLNVTSLK